MTVPEVARCPDGHFRRVVYGLGPYIADYPEQVLAAGIVQGWCPCCLKYQSNLGDPEDALHRCCEHSEELIAQLDVDVLWDDYGIIANIIVSNRIKCASKISNLLYSSPSQQTFPARTSMN